MGVTWGPPADPNGIILSYNLFVMLNEEDAQYLPGPSRMNFTIEDINTRSYVLTDLHEFATYSLRLAAATSVGIGNRTEPVMRKTLMDGKGNPYLISLNHVHVHVYTHTCMLYMCNYI